MTKFSCNKWITRIWISSTAYNDYPSSYIRFGIICAWCCWSRKCCCGKEEKFAIRSWSAHMWWRWWVACSFSHIFFLRLNLGFFSHLPLKKKGLCDCRRKTNCQDANSKFCPKDEVFTNGGSPCDTSCAHLGKSCGVNSLIRVIACTCPKGYARLGNGSCVGIKSKACRREYDATTKINDTPAKQADCKLAPPGDW